jgi:hypothetical protein
MNTVYSKQYTVNKKNECRIKIFILYLHSDPLEGETKTEFI